MDVRQISWVVNLIAVASICLIQGISCEDAKMSSIAYDLCGYNSFCTKGNKSVPAGLFSCCADCSCSDDCYLSNQCCPDADVKNQDTNMKCRYQYEYFDRHRNIYFEPAYTTYFIVDTCTDDQNQGIVDGCLNPDALKDHVFVSDKQSKKIYKNEKCALCNGVQSYERWTMVVFCSFSDELLDYERRDDFILQSCGIVSRPPKGSEDLYDFMQCSPEAIDVCNATGEWDFDDDDIERGCETYNMMYRSENLSPGHELVLKSYEIYKNPYCYLCNKKQATTSNPTCLHDVESYRGSLFAMAQFTAMISDIEPQLVKENSCRMDEIEDPVTGKCKHLYCPFGETAIDSICTKLIDETFVSLLAVYKIKVSAPESEIDDAKVFQAIAEDIDRKFSRSECDLCDLKMFSENFLLVRAKPSHACPMSKLIKVIEYMSHMKVSGSSKAIIELNQTNNYTINSMSSFGYIEIYGLEDLLSFWKHKCMRGVHLSTKFTCERLEFSVKELVNVGISNETLDHLLRQSDPYKFNGNITESRLICLSDYKHIVNAGSLIGKHAYLCVVYILLIRFYQV